VYFSACCAVVTSLQSGSHDSAEDARAALDLVRLKVQHGEGRALSVMCNIIDSRSNDDVSMPLSQHKHQIVSKHLGTVGSQRLHTSIQQG
jgi:hypothetical protein